MGNLSCVSCKVKEKDSDRSHGELPTIDHKSATLQTEAIPIEYVDSDSELAKDRVRFAEQASHRTTVRELYDTIRSHKLKEDNDNNLDDLEKAARAIVDMTVFLATRVIYPAYMTYLQEDHPEIYKQYFEKECNDAVVDSDITIKVEER